MAEVVGLCAIAVALSVKRRKRCKQTMKRSRKVWTRQWILNRPKHGAYYQLLNELRLSDPFSYKNFLRMDATCFEELLSKVGPMIEKEDTNMRQAISPAERLALTLRFLATGQ